jgi:inhibitor of cysteine peptidase
MKGTKIILAIILGVTMATGIACGGKGESTTPTPTVNKVNVDASYNGSEVALSAGDQLIVTLESNPGSTGLSWNLSAISDTSIIAKISDEYISPTPSDPPVVGQGGQEVWTFEALDAGTATISMKYNRPTVPQEVYNTFEITVNVD